MSAVEIIKCVDCGQFNVSIDNVRIGGHKCSGRWIIHRVLKGDIPNLTTALKEIDELIEKYTDNEDIPMELFDDYVVKDLKKLRKGLE